MSNGTGVIMDHHHSHELGPCGYKSISWSAIIVGALVGIGLSFLLNLFSIAIGLSVFTVDNQGISSLAVGGLIGLLIGAIVSMYVSGFTAGYLGRPYSRKHNLGILYGFASWALALIITIFLAAHVGQYLTWYSKFIATPSAVVMTTNESAPIVRDRVATVTPAETERAANAMGVAAFIVFVLFFIGAVSSAFGAYHGMACKDKEDETCYRKDIPIR